MEKGIVTVKYLQQYIRSKDFDEENRTHYFLKLTEEVGELSKAIRKNLRPADSEQIKETIEEELWDVIYFTLALANTYGIDMERVIPLKEKINNKKYNTGIEFSPADGI